ncbi:class V chitinase-like [Amaranthus tricolor]|uniref:class V chitinase-like n=1 Tax=Amaranthus tricolor TaxID=29722 RepID=UPI00258F0B7A|nr:class V chitinase-like [Amaranthus tricolor]
MSSSSSNADAVKGGYWAEAGGLSANQIHSEHFTHLFAAFATLNQNNTISLSGEIAEFPKIVKQRNPNVKVLLSLGGAAIDSNVFNNMAREQITRMIFIRSTIDQALKFKYDGIDLDWEGQSRIDEMNNLGQLIIDFRAEIRHRGLNLLLTAALFYRATVPWGEGNPRFPVQAINANLDWVNVMSYDINLPNNEDRVAKPHAPLKSPSQIVNSGSAGIQSWINEGLSPAKIVFGLPFYGHACKLVNAHSHGILAPIIGPDTSAFGASTVSYDGLRTFIEQQGAAHQYDENYVTDYCYKDQVWVSYDDISSISTKVIYAREMALRGYFAWCLHQDHNWDLSREASQAWNQPN